MKIHLGFFFPSQTKDNQSITFIKRNNQKNNQKKVLLKEKEVLHLPPLRRTRSFKDREDRV